jgi:hypothetical protein
MWLVRYHFYRLALSSGMCRILGENQNGQCSVGARVHRFLAGPVETLQFTGDRCRSVVALVLGLELGGLRIKPRESA